MRRILIAALILAGCGGPEDEGRLSRDQKVVVTDPERSEVFFGQGGPHAFDPVQVGSACFVVEDAREDGGKYRPVKVRTEEANPRVGTIARSNLRPAK